jgi:hypothetical protein
MGKGIGFLIWGTLLSLARGRVEDNQNDHIHSLSSGDRISIWDILNTNQRCYQHFLLSLPIYGSTGLVDLCRFSVS